MIKYWLLGALQDNCINQAEANIWGGCGKCGILVNVLNPTGTELVVGIA